MARTRTTRIAAEMVANVLTVEVEQGPGVAAGDVVQEGEVLVELVP